MKPSNPVSYHKICNIVMKANIRVFLFGWWFFFAINIVFAIERFDVAFSVADTIRTEATISNNDPVGHPLPLAGHWNTGYYPNAKGWDPWYEISLVEQGYYVLPSFQLAPPHLNKINLEYYKKAIKRAAELRLPLTFVCTQFESMLTTEKRFFDLPEDKNPNVLGTDGKIDKMVSPFGPTEQWKEAGRSWTDRGLIDLFQLWYPDPPLVIFLSNNEHTKLSWQKAEYSKRYLAKYGKGRDADFKRKVFGDSWIERYKAIQAGMRDGLFSQIWKQRSIFVGYSAFGPSYFGRWNGWTEYSLTTKNRISPWPLSWDGASPPYYVHNWDESTDYTVWSPQVEAMNWIFMLKEAFVLNPEFWWEISVWDGNASREVKDKRKIYESRGQTFTPERYGGFVQFGMWLLRPRVVREYRGWTESREKQGEYFMAILKACNRVHKNKTLSMFWRKGELVGNPSNKHPYQHNIPEEYENAKRWFMLDTNLTPARPWSLDTEIPVWAIALVLDEKPMRKWLLYVQSPLENRKNVEVSLPDYGIVKTNVSVDGSFYVINENEKKVRLLEWY